MLDNVLVGTPLNVDGLTSVCVEADLDCWKGELQVANAKLQNDSLACLLFAVAVESTKLFIRCLLIRLNQSALLQYLGDSLSSFIM